MSTAFSLRLAATLADLAGIRHFVEKSAVALGADPDVVPGIVLAVDEAATNTIVHGYGGRGGEITVSLRCRGDALVVDVTDRAPPFDPTTMPAPDVALPLEERPIGGMGIFLMRKVVDEVSYRRLPNGSNKLVMVKRAALRHPA
jgi:anti-sigma regulatory factor (Ser/Thr protein kinase)